MEINYASLCALIKDSGRWIILMGLLFTPPFPFCGTWKLAFISVCNELGRKGAILWSIACGWGAWSPFQMVGSEWHSPWEGWDLRDTVPLWGSDGADVRGCNRAKMCSGLRCDSSAPLSSPCGPAGADGCPGWASCESWPGCSHIHLLAFGKSGGRSVPGCAPIQIWHTDRLCTWDHKNTHTLSAFTVISTDFISAKTCLC